MRSPASRDPSTIEVMAQLTVMLVAVAGFTTALFLGVLAIITFGGAPLVATVLGFRYESLIVGGVVVGLVASVLLMIIRRAFTQQRTIE